MEKQKAKTEWYSGRNNFEISGISRGGNENSFEDKITDICKELGIESRRLNFLRLTQSSAWTK